MSYCKKEGKDQIIFATEEYLAEPSTAVLLPDDPNQIDTSNQGAILPNGEINWDCPCLGNLPNGPCGPNFREAFSCWVENKDNEESFAENCFENFTQWEKCLNENRDIYKPEGGEPAVKNDTESIISETKESSETVPSIEEEEQGTVNPIPVSGKETRAIAAASAVPKT